ncbi:MAG: hypothetical protein KQ78_01472 [Candidatus Izimaplasma bacterium HR2]|nr:MAG: hypothetical protein KQ78_01472 [Candidatus Izimaplasma bacterium HR2]
MKHRYEMIDKDGRYMISEYNSECNLLKVTTYLYPKEDVSIEEILNDCGFTITSKTNIEKPKIITLTKGTEK